MSRRARQRRDKRAEIPDEAALSRLVTNGAEAWRTVPDAAAWVDELRGNTMTDNPMAQYVEVYPPRPEAFGGTGAPAGINWSAVGTSTPEQTRQFAAALLAAADKADELNKAQA